MTFREWQWTQFAAAAIQGQLASMSNAEVVAKIVELNKAEGVDPYRWGADSACRYADAMMAAIDKREKERDDV